MKAICKIAFILILGVGCAFAQSNDTLKLDPVYISKDYNPTISDAFKINENPGFVETKVETPKLNYPILKKQILTTFTVEPIEPAKMKREKLPKLYKSYVKIGLGSNLTTLADIYYNNTRSRKHSYGIQASHFGSQGQIKDAGFSGFSNNSIDIYGKKFMRKHLASGGLDYNYDALHFYGYDPAEFTTIDKKSTKQFFSKAGFDAGVKSFLKDSADINYDVKLNYDYLWDNYSADEHNVVVDAELQQFYNKELIKLNASLDINSFGNSQDENYTNGILKLHPQIISRGDKWRLNAGLGIFMDADNTARFYFKPIAEFKYNVVDDIIIPYAGITGEVKRNNFRSFTDENPFLISNLELRNSNHKPQLYAGIRGSFSSKIAFNVKASRGKVEALPLFVNDTSVSLANKFAVIYDTVTVSNFSGEVTYRQGEKLNLMLRGDYFIYEMRNEQKPWHLPSYKVTLSGKYNLKDKIIAKVDIFAFSKQFAKTFDPTEGEELRDGVYAKTLNGLVDINLGVEYRYSSRLSAFLNFNNLAAVRYYRWNNYPTQRFNVLGGVSYSF